MALYEWKNKLSEMVGQTLIEVTGMKKGSQDIEFRCESGRRFLMQYEQDCCASCDIEDIIGDPADLLNSPLLMAEDASNDDSLIPDTFTGDGHYRNDSETWTFIKLATVKGYVTIRWYGSSNGYYSESPTFSEVS